MGHAYKICKNIIQIDKGSYLLVTNFIWFGEIQSNLAGIFLT